MISFHPFGGAQEVGASCGILKLGMRHILVDAGMRPAARPGQSRTPDLDALKGFPLDAILITHAHIDHTGCLPLVASLFPTVPIYATESTIALMRILLLDSARIMEQEHLAHELETPLYGQTMVVETLARIIPVAFHQELRPVAANQEISVTYLPAGHILGAGMLHLTSPWGSVLHTGDISVGHHRTITGVDLNTLPQVDMLICEGTYGNRSHKSRKDQEQNVVATIQQVIAQGGRVLIPAFAVGRAQELILILKAFRTSGVVSPVTIYVDGMCKSVCEAYQQQSHDLHPALQKFLTNSQRPLFVDPTFGVLAVHQGMRPRVIQSDEPAIIISTSGMLTGGPAPLYATKLAQDPRNAIIFTGYQDEESPGAAMLKATQGGTITLNGQRVTLGCPVYRYGLSGHADLGQLEQVIRLVQPQQLVLVHGDHDALSHLAARFKKLAVAIPAAGDVVTLTRRTPTVSLQAGQRVDIPAPTPVVVEPVADPTPLKPAPTLDDLYAIATANGIPPRPWTAIELGAAWYGTAYQPTLRPVVEGVLSVARSHFRTKRLGSQTVFTPRPVLDTGEPNVAAPPKPQPDDRWDGVPIGQIVLVLGSAAPPDRVQLGLITGEPTGSTVPLVVEAWKSASQVRDTIQGVTPMNRLEWVGLEHAEIQAQLKALRATVDAMPIDVLNLWQAQNGQPARLETLMASAPTLEEQVATGITLMRRGLLVWKREGSRWIPKPFESLNDQALITRHLDLITQVGAQVTHTKDGRTGTLTGRGGWLQVEVRWDSGTVELVKDGLVRIEK